ncbi:MAG: ABC transporter permease, partial [Pseudomonadota bacterium]
MSGLLTVLRKECIDNLRDRRALLSSSLLAILGPVALVAFMSFVLDSALGKSEAPLALTVSGAEHAPQLIAYLERENTDIKAVTLEDPAAAVRDGWETLVLSIPQDYGERFATGQPLALPLVFDSSAFGP